MDTQVPPQPQAQPPASAPLPFEDPGRGFFVGLWESVVLLVAHPGEAFRRIRGGDSVGRPLVYAIVMVYVSLAAGLVWFSLQAIPMGLFQALGEPTGKTGFETVFAGVSVLAVAAFGVVLIPVVTTIYLVLSTLVVHLFLLLFGGARRGLVGTFRVLAYSTTAQLAAIVPFCGGIIQAIWALVLEILGLARVHETTEVRAAGAVLTPLVLCCLCFLALLALGVLAPILAQAHGR